MKYSIFLRHNVSLHLPDLGAGFWEVVTIHNIFHKPLALNLSNQPTYPIQSNYLSIKLNQSTHLSNLPTSQTWPIQYQSTNRSNYPLIQSPHLSTLSNRPTHPTKSTHQPNLPVHPSIRSWSQTIPPRGWSIIKTLVITQHFVLCAWNTSLSPNEV